MTKGARWVWTIIRLLALATSGALLAVLRFFYNTPQPLASVLPGEDRLYKWTFGHVFYKVAGREQHPPLILLHAPGIGSSSYEMRSLVDPLVQRYRVYALDLPGSGLSDRPAIEYSADLYVQLCRDFLRDVVAQPATLVAGGLCCSYAVAVAGSADDPFPLCERLVLISPVSLFASTRTPFWLSQLLKNHFAGIVLYACLTTRFLLRYVLAWQRRMDYRQLTREDLDAAFANAHQFGAQHAVLAQLAGKLDLAISPDYTIRQPTLIIWGVHALGAMQRNVHQQAISMQTQVVLLQDAGVRAYQEAPERVAANVLEWSADETTPSGEQVQRD